MSALLAATSAGLGAGLAASLITLAIERFGGKRGGVLGTLPTTIVPASLGLWAQSPHLFEEAMCAVPPGMCLNALFLWLWRVTPPHLPSRLSLTQQLAAMSVLSLGLWAVGASAWVTLARPQLNPLYGAFGGLACLVILGLWASDPTQASLKGRARVQLTTLLMRGLAAALAVGSAVWLSKHTQGALSGVLSIFPAIFWTSMVSVWRSQGAAVSAGAVGPMMLGASSVGLYALLSLWTFPRFGAVGGALLAWLGAALGASWPADRWLHRAPALSKAPAQQVNVKGSGA